MARPRKEVAEENPNDVFIKATIHVPGSLPYDVRVNIKNARGGVMLSQFKPVTFAQTVVSGLNKFGKLEIK